MDRTAYDQITLELIPVPIYTPFSYIESSDTFMGYNFLGSNTEVEVVLRL